MKKSWRRTAPRLLRRTEERAQSEAEPPRPPCAVTIAHHFPSSLRGWRRLRSISRCICNSAECEDGRATMNP
uniref:Uncharacterized protein n=1 Tax=Pristionchus pacificus TaxID=54126 RepID=A0A2A6BCF5_PRIPA|eukprot:PDM63563.1 hypothetical protein PRIPAC_49536 [Pristionchus pacificus]